MRKAVPVARIVAFIMCGILLSAIASPVSAPERIIALAPSCAEIVAGLGLENRLVGITENTGYPAQISNLPKVGSYVDLNLEAIVSLKPDLALATDDGNPEAVLQRLREFSVPVLTLNLRSYTAIQQSILSVGLITGAEQQAKKLTEHMTSVADCIRKRTEGVPRPSVLFAYESYPIVSAGNATFTDDLIEMSGGRSITHDVAISYPRLTLETILAKDPDVIILTSMNPNDERNEKLRWWKQYPSLRAIKKNQVFVLDSTHLDRPSHMIVSGFFELARTLHPERFPNADCLK